MKAGQNIKVEEIIKADRNRNVDQSRRKCEDRSKKIGI